MASILRTLLSRPGYFRHRTVSLQSTFKSCLMNSLYTISTEGKRRHPEVRPKDEATWTKTIKFQNIYFESVTGSPSQENIMRDLLQMRKIGLSSVRSEKFERHLKSFVKSERFKEFCKVLDKKFPEISPSVLPAFIDLSSLGVPVSSSLMRKLFHLILDNINQYSVYEIVSLYVRLSAEDFAECNVCKNILKACEVYFKEVFPSDLGNLKLSPSLIHLVKVKGLPLHVRELISRKLIEEAILTGSNASLMVEAVCALCRFPPTSLSQNILLVLIKKVVCNEQRWKEIEKLSRAYRTLVYNHPSYYDEGVASFFADVANAKVQPTLERVAITLNLCLLGYLDKNWSSMILDFMNQKHRNLHSYKFLLLSNVLVRHSAHELENFKSFKMGLESLRIRVDSFEFSDRCSWCLHQTYMGFDTRDLLSKIFGQVNEEGTSERIVLALHHLAKVYFSDGYTALEEKRIDALFLNEIKEIESYPPETLNDYFGSTAYVLKGCSTSDKHCIHFASLFGSDGKPIDLSEYANHKLEPNEFINIEKVTKPPGSKMIVFQVFWDRQPIYFRNAPVMSGLAKMYLKIFQNIDCSVIFLPPVFFNMTPENKSEYLKSEIDKVLSKEKVSCEQN